jgi:phosphoglycerate dehydrogenase-like enzyme
MTSENVSQTLGVIGARAVAQRVMRVAQAMGMRVLCCVSELDDALATRLGVAGESDRVEIACKSDAFHFTYHC